MATPTPAPDQRDPVPSETTKLILGAREGDRAALGALASKVRFLCHLLARSYVRAAVSALSSAEDFAQRAVDAALRNLDDLVPYEGSLGRALKLKAAAILRRDIARFYKRLTSGGTQTSGLDFDPEHSGQETPSRHLRRIEAARKLVGAWKHLSQDERKVFVLRGIEELPSLDVAAVLAKSDEAIRKTYERALTKLRDRLDEADLRDLLPPP